MSFKRLHAALHSLQSARYLAVNRPLVYTLAPWRARETMGSRGHVVFVARLGFFDVVTFEFTGALIFNSRSASALIHAARLAVPRA